MISVVFRGPEIWIVNLRGEISNSHGKMMNRKAGKDTSCLKYANKKLYYSTFHGKIKLIEWYLL